VIISFLAGIPVTLHCLLIGACLVTPGMCWRSVSAVPSCSHGTTWQNPLGGRKIVDGSSKLVTDITKDKIVRYGKHHTKHKHDKRQE